jgi:hypothetical protein
MLVTLKVFTTCFDKKWSSSGVNSCGWGNYCLSCWCMVPLVHMCAFLLVVLCSLSCFQLKKILCVWFLGRLCSLARCDSPQCRHVAGYVFGRVHCSLLCDLPQFTHLGLCAQYPFVWKYASHLLHCSILGCSDVVAQFRLSYFVDIVMCISVYRRGLDWWTYLLTTHRS